MEQLNLGQLRKARRNRGMDMKAAAEVIGKEKNAIYRYENGITSPRVDDLLALLAAYGVDAKDVFSFSIEREG